MVRRIKPFYTTSILNELNCLIIPPEHISSTLEYFKASVSLIHFNMSCLLSVSDVDAVLNTFTAILNNY